MWHTRHMISSEIIRCNSNVKQIICLFISTECIKCTWRLQREIKRLRREKEQQQTKTPLILGLLFIPLFIFCCFACLSPIIKCFCCSFAKNSSTAGSESREQVCFVCRRCSDSVFGRVSESCRYCKFLILTLMSLPGGAGTEKALTENLLYWCELLQSCALLLLLFFFLDLQAIWNELK